MKIKNYWSAENLKKARAARWATWYEDRGICRKCKQPQAFHSYGRCPVDVFRLVSVPRSKNSIHSRAGNFR